MAMALGFFSRMCSCGVTIDTRIQTPTSDSLECGNLAWSVSKPYQGAEDRLGSIKGIPMSEVYSLPMNAKSLVGSVMASSCGSHNPLHMSIVEASSQRMMIDKAFSVPNCVLSARVSHHSQQLQKKVWGAVTGPRARDFSDTWEK